MTGRSGTGSGRRRAPPWPRGRARRFAGLVRVGAAAAPSIAVAALVSLAVSLAAPLAGAFAASLIAAPVEAQAAHVLVVTGLGGDPEYTARFRAWGSRLVEAVRSDAVGGGGGSVVWLAERADLHPAVTGVSRKEAVRRAVASLAERASPSDLVVLVLFGHGSEQGGETRLNLPGPDLTAAELAAWLAPLEPRRVVVVNAASASGGFVAPLSARGRVVITATRSAGETQATRFGGPFVDALAGGPGGGADTDKDGRVSALEAFEYARREVARQFAASNTLPTEHPLIDDDGDGVGSLEPGGSDGALAARVALAATGGGMPGERGPASSVAEGGSGADSAAADPGLRALLREKARLESELAELRARQTGLPESEYRAALERLLLEIARNGRSIRERGGGGG